MQRSVVTTKFVLTHLAQSTRKYTSAAITARPVAQRTTVPVVPVGSQPHSTHAPNTVTATSSTTLRASVIQCGCRSRTIRSSRCRFFWSNPTTGAYRRAGRIGAADRGPSTPAEAVQLVVVDAEVVRELVHDGDADLLDDLVARRAHLADGEPVDRDPVGHDEPPVVLPLGQRHAVVEPEQVLGRVPVLDDDGDVVDQLGEPLGDAVEGVRDQLGELVLVQLQHGRHATGPGLAVGPRWYRPRGAADRRHRTPDAEPQRRPARGGHLRGLAPA